MRQHGPDKCVLACSCITRMRNRQLQQRMTLTRQVPADQQCMSIRTEMHGLT